MLFFSTTSATTFDSSLKQTREKKEKTLKPFSLFSFLSLILILLLSRLHKGREDEHALFFLFFFRVVKFYIEKDSKKRRAIDFDCFAHHPEAAAKNPKLTKKRLFITHIKHLSLSRLIDTVQSVLRYLSRQQR